MSSWYVDCDVHKCYRICVFVIQCQRFIRAGWAAVCLQRKEIDGAEAMTTYLACQALHIFRDISFVQTEQNKKGDKMAEAGYR